MSDCADTLELTPEPHFAGGKSLLQVALFKSERDEALERETASSEVLSLISKSRGDLELVFQTILERARKRFDRAVKFEDENRKAGLDDDKFYSGEQWPSDIVAERNFARRPILTINKLPTFVHQITNDQRMNRPAINISPIGDRGCFRNACTFRTRRSARRRCGWSRKDSPC